MAHMAELLRAEEAYLEDRTQALLPPEDGGAAVTLAAPVLLGQEEAIRRRLVRSMARAWAWSSPPPRRRRCWTWGPGAAWTCREACGPSVSGIG